MSGPAESLDGATASGLRVIAFAMGAGIFLLTVVSLFLFARSAVSAPTPQALKFINTLTILSMAASFAAIVASEFAWKELLAGANASIQTAFVVRAAVRESAALLGGVTFLLAGQNGVLRAFPSYWVDLVPAGLFWFFLYMHWPSLANLKAELAQIAP
ncbi:MAG: hypothetical protein ACHQ49_07040 [Elusimicrobiota bacterium]